MNIDKVYIKSAYEFFELVHIGLRDDIQFFRGQANAQWGILPSIYREKCTLTGISEKMIVQEFYSRRPDEFSGIINKFNLLAKMQHHGLVTRLLDLTNNPSVALYFACHDLQDKDGEVFILNTRRDSILLPHEADLIMRFYLEEISEFGQYDMVDYYNKVKQKLSDDELLKVFYFLAGNHPHVVLTDLISQRMIRQQSVFAIVPNRCDNSIYEEYIKQNGKRLLLYIKEKGLINIANEIKIGTIIDDHKNDIIGIHHDNKQYIIEANVKKHILRQLDSIGVNEASIFPELQYEGKNIVDKYLYLSKQSD